MSPTETMEETATVVTNKREGRLGKRLAYLLRYGAEKEGLTVSEGGFVDLMSLLKVPMMRHYRPDEIVQEVDNSISYRGIRRFERKQMNNELYVRAIYGRRMERNPCHEGSQIPRLLELCMTKICSKLDDYDMQDFPDEFIINAMIHKLKRQKRLNNRAWKALLGSTIEHLDLDGCYLTETSMKLIGQRCPYLRVLNLTNCGYIVTDHILGQLSKKLSHLENINVSQCQHLTDRSMDALIKNCPRLQTIVLCCVQVSQACILRMMTSFEHLRHLDIFNNKNMSEEGRVTLQEISRARNVTVVLKHLNESVIDEHMEVS